ncbi:MAG: apolipoprotein N-acyltransferase [Bdellovibrionales bacterium]|nr:apolipoprotein N-acyltransferase [Bdellovibrionales bacterium]
MKKIKNFLNTYSLSILAGFFIGTSYIPLPPWANLFCFVPIWLLWQKLANESSPYKKIFIAGWITQFILTLLGFNWITFTAHEFGYLPWPLAFCVLMIFCAFANLDIPLAGVCWFYFQKKLKLSAPKSLALMAIITALFEAWVPTLFPWNYGYPWLWANLPIAQTAELIGFQGISSIVILINVGSYYIWQSLKSYQTQPNNKNKRQLLLTFCATAGAFVFLNIAGVGLKKSLPQTDSEINAVIIQANIGNLQKQQAEKGWEFREYITGRYVDLSKKALSEIQSHNDTTVDFVLWPETAYPYDIDQRYWSTESALQKHYPPAARTLIDLSQDLGTNLLIGGYGYSPQDGKLTNTFFVIEKNGEIQPHPYYKTILLAFGEYIPGDQYIPPKIRELIPAGDFSRGTGPQIIQIESPDLKIGPQICYESLFPSFTKNLSDLGAEVIFNVTNDSWYGTWQEPYQHLYMTLARAIEYRRPLIRTTNTGISTAILADGTILQKSPLNQEWTGLFKIPYKKNPTATFYQLYPWLIDSLLIFLLLLIIGRASFERVKKS